VLSYCAGAAKPQALRYVAVCVSLAVVHTLVAVKVSYAQKHFSTALSEKNRGERGFSQGSFAAYLLAGEFSR
jgi:hypothetical protein